MDPNYSNQQRDSKPYQSRRSDDTRYDKRRFDDESYDHKFSRDGEHYLEGPQGGPPPERAGDSRRRLVASEFEYSDVGRRATSHTWSEPPSQGSSTVRRGSDAYAERYGDSWNSSASDRLATYDRERNVSRASRVDSENAQTKLPSGPHRGKGPKGWRRSDEKIHDNICELMAAHGELDASDIEVEVGNGEVTLSGSVDTRDAKRLAENVAEVVSGVRDVHNRLKVTGPGSGGAGTLDNGRSSDGATFH